MEFIEEALYRYTPLVDALASRHWLRHLREKPDLLRKVRELEGLLPEVMEHLERRGKAEGWPRGSRIPRRLRRLRVVRERALDGRVELAWVLEGLRWQPESELEAVLSRAVAATGGTAWSSEDVRVAPGLEGAREVHLVRGEEALVGTPGAKERSAVLARLHAWASRAPTR
ncbi:hypothetical protein [Myxococcus sp. AS-1-15]|uniref:hypothetical protein n=1 Tax=Myxococcus sp. AS-1-15 TaxID=2874600 RepID=UPI001CBD7DDF|nr:hypothetical protein [Myxococcus sp. AS-1-15]MBZ4395988.1 hypothetical protein [Myxococcus sp. AS-1-15]